MALGRGLALCLLVVMEMCAGGPPRRASCPYPPSQWCSSLQVALQCQVQKQCMELSATRQRRPPVAVALYYDSLCPGSRLFLTQQLFPTWTLLQDVMELTLVPYGNTQELQNATALFSCQHGEAECQSNMMEACILHLAGPASLQIIHCMEAAAHILQAARPCVELYAPALRWAAVEGCTAGGRGGQLMRTHAARTRALKPPHIPWVTFNGELREEVQDRALGSLFHLVCDLYKGGKPPACTGAPVRLDRSLC
ncbi:unnamed protein product [Gadus morhua 'NCC']